MNLSAQMHTDDIIEDVGGMSYFQLMMLALVSSSKMLAAWGMLTMMFVGTEPDWWCIPLNETGSDSFKNNQTSEYCPETNNDSCTFVYSRDMHTIVDQWDLVCERSSITPMIISVQMGGVLVGSTLAGQAADVVGRKLTFYCTMVLHAVFNLIAAFSINWQMFAVFRFLIGGAGGAIIVANYPYFMEFVGRKWRPICSAVPFWEVGPSLLILSCWLHPDWRHQHIILGAIHVPFLFGWFVTPESFRWLAVQGRDGAADKVVDQMCRYNRTIKPANTRRLLKQVSEEERQASAGKKYTYLDIYKGASVCRTTLLIHFNWLSMSVVFYGISFGVGQLAGNIYLNMFLMFAVQGPATVATFFMNNKLGRKWTCVCFYTPVVVSAFSVAIVSRLAPEAQRGSIISALALISKVCTGAVWTAFEVFGTEMYPTVTRNLGYGAANTVARVGGILSPYIFLLGGDDLMAPFLLVGVLMTLCTIVTLVLTETKGKALQDTSGIRKLVNMEIEVNGESLPLKLK